MAMMGRTWGPQGQRGQHRVETTETTAMGTTWGPSGGYGDNVGMVGTTWGQNGNDGDDVEMMGTTWGPQGSRGDNKITKNAIKLLFWTTYFYTLLPILRSKFKICNATEAG